MAGELGTQPTQPLTMLPSSSTPPIITPPTPDAAPPSSDIRGISPAEIQKATPAQDLSSTPPPAKPPNFWHKAVHALLGTSPQYSVDGSGNTTATPVQNKPGQLFRSILSGAILGAAAGQEAHTGSGWSSADIGAKASMENQQKQDLMKKQQAQQEFENKQKADESGRQKQLLVAQNVSLPSKRTCPFTPVSSVALSPKIRVMTSG